MTTLHDDDGYLTGQLLVAMPQMSDPRFQRSVIYICAHSERGAMGIVVNKLIDGITFSELLHQLDIKAGVAIAGRHVHFGGPVETGRGFVLHTVDYMQDASLMVDGEVALTATVDILREIAGGTGPRQSLLALGYAGWDAGQLEAEMQANAWLIVGPDEPLLFDDKLDSKWDRALAKLGVASAMLSGEAGHA
jgi:putative transcriptional regulator